MLNIIVNFLFEYNQLTKLLRQRVVGRLFQNIHHYQHLSQTVFGVLHQSVNALEQFLNERCRREKIQNYTRRLEEKLVGPI